MTDRLAEFASVAPKHSDASSVSLSASEDIESCCGSGRSEIDTDAEKQLTKFSREADAVDKVYVWATSTIQSVTSSLRSASPHLDYASLSAHNHKLDAVEQKLGSVRARVARMSRENGAVAGRSPATMKIRISRTTKLADDFLKTVSALQGARERAREVARAGMRRDILAGNPDIAGEDLDRALDSENEKALDELLMRDDNKNNKLRNEMEELRVRNRDIHGLTRSLELLHSMFQEMSMVVSGQQELINDIEHDVLETKAVARRGGEEMERARAHQRSARKKKMCVFFAVVGMVIAVVLGIVMTVCLQGKCNMRGGANGNNAGGRQVTSGQPSTSSSGSSSMTATTGDLAQRPERDQHGRQALDAFLDARRSIWGRRERMFVREMVDGV